MCVLQMRTPLNAALLGMNLVEKDAKRRLSTNLQLDDKYYSQEESLIHNDIQTIRDVRSAVTTVTEICNDLLDYDKVKLL